ncbi:MAG: hypothetical protein ACJ798_01015 [Phenylobacterium sp.]
MTRELEGTLVRLDRTGVGVVDCENADQYVYFTPRQIEGYRGETVDELAAGGAQGWTSGKEVVIVADVDPSGNVNVKSVALK